uniref:Type II/III secretion system secretin-like domain-containing protein n=1 Tax=mine drainage metagenome TaxID=410659 RepID=E6QIM0_9ZZZZ
MDGERYPIETASYSSATLSPAISAAATAAGYGALAQSQNIPQIQYENLGLTLKARPKVMRSEDVALTLDLKIEALAGPSLNGIPILTSRQFTGVLTMRAGETAVLFSDLSSQETRALNGMPGISDIPGLQDITDIQLSQNVARLIVLVTPSIARETQPKGHSPMLMVDTTTPASH